MRPNLNIPDLINYACKPGAQQQTPPWRRPGTQQQTPHSAAALLTGTTLHVPLLSSKPLIVCLKGVIDRVSLVIYPLTHATS